MTDMTSRYRAAWESARARARRYRDDRDEYQRIAAYCQQSLRRDGVPTDIDVEEEVRDAIAAVGIEWDTPHGEIPDDLVDAITGALRPALAKTIEQRNRYRAAWESARARARRYRDDRDGTGVPVILSIGDTRAEVATITFDTTQPVGPQVAAMLRALADEFADDSAALADQLAEHREAIAYALRHTLADWEDATGHAEGTAAGTLARALDWITGHPTPPRDLPNEVTGLALEVEDYRGATARVEARQDAMDRRLEETVRRLDDVETTVNRTDGDTPQNRIASQVEIAETLTTAGDGDR